MTGHTIGRLTAIFRFIVFSQQSDKLGFRPQAVPIRIRCDMVEFPETFPEGLFQELQRRLFITLNGMESGDAVIRPYYIRIDFHGTLEGFVSLPCVLPFRKDDSQVVISHGVFRIDLDGPA